MHNSPQTKFGYKKEPPRKEWLMDGSGVNRQFRFLQKQKQGNASSISSFALVSVT